MISPLPTANLVVALGMFGMSFYSLHNYRYGDVVVSVALGGLNLFWGVYLWA